MTENTTSKNQKISLPLAIVLAGFLVAGAIVYTNTKDGGGIPQVSGGQKENSRPEENIKPVGSLDHIFGSPNAPVKLVEFSDPECPYCKIFHQTMGRIMSEYGKSGQVAWVYRHFPIDSIHSKARKAAEGSECAGELGGNAKFWEYFERYFEITPSNNGIDLAQLPQIAEAIGLDRANFESCLSSGKFSGHVEENYQDAAASGGEGTPYSIVIAPNGQKIVINGAQSFLVVKQIIDTALKLK